MMGKTTINVGGRLFCLDEPQVMGILNVTPDSFYAESRCEGRDAILRRIAEIRDEGAGMIDIGAYSTRPGAGDVSQTEELDRLLPAVELTRKEWPEAVVSVDTFRSQVACEAVRAGAHVVNDVTGGEGDSGMFPMVAELHIPYVLTHNGEMQGSESPRGSKSPDIMMEVLRSLGRKVEQLHEMGVADIIIDPGFGFGKTLEQNYEMMCRLSEFKLLDCPILVGVSRKSMIYRLLDTTPEEALNGTTVLNTVALMKGASILRVHDVKAASEAVMLIGHLRVKSEELRVKDSTISE